MGAGEQGADAPKRQDQKDISVKNKIVQNEEIRKGVGRSNM
jgi:hypothetical protein